MSNVSKVLIALVLATGAAHAQPSPTPADAQADAALAEGRKLYDVQDWDAAIAKFKEAYKLRPEAPSLFNLAQSYRLKGDCASAANFYKTFKRNYPTAKNIDKVDKFITEMDECVKSGVKPVGTKSDPTDLERPGNQQTGNPATTGTAGMAVVPVTPPPPAKDRSWMKWAGIGAGGVGLLSTGLGIKFALDGKGFKDDLKEKCAVSCTSEQALAIESDGESANKKALIFTIVGGGLVVGGAVLLVLSLSGGSSGEAQHISLVPTPDGASATYSFAF